MHTHDVFSELIPANNTVVREAPATLYCRVTDTSGTLETVETVWYIEGIRFDFFEGPIDVSVSPNAPSNLTVLFASEPGRVSCRTSFYPDLDLGVFRVGKCSAS